MIPLDDQLRPTAVRQHCSRSRDAPAAEQADFASQYGSRKCIVKLGCWGPVVQCNVGKRG